MIIMSDHVSIYSYTLNFYTKLCHLEYFWEMILLVII